MLVIVSPATRSGRADTQQYGGWDTELDCVPVEGLVFTRYISFVIKRVTFYSLGYVYFYTVKLLAHYCN